ncbi:hypothetical protein [Aquimarina sp. RZ0]|uniref:hypothetical protein n=1 Tax=Aquimarina sp. RZ0 TaxID=2607730 RepID=UPI0011F239A5|nr:hypothetical protein [Aquimarina sp. RZ0]KAA1244726.1 hypothetical protein F0000_15240 [Aquimarina sp. RZ0]
MKTFKKTIAQLGMLSILTLTLSIFMTSCEKEEFDSEIGAVEIEKDQDFNSLVYNNKSYSFEEVNKNATLANLLKKPSYYVESKDEIIKYVFDTEEEASKNFESGELDSQGDRALNVRFAIELFRHTYHRDRIFRKVIFLNNFNSFLNANLAPNVVNQASSSRVRVTGLNSSRALNVRYFDRARQQNLLFSDYIDHRSNGELVEFKDFTPLGMNDKINSIQVYLSLP